MMGPDNDMESLALSDDPPSSFHSALSSSAAASSAGGGISGGDPLLTPSPSSSYLDPPSYADAVYSPTASAPSSSRLALSPYASITVSDPQTAPDPSPSLVPGATAPFTTYLITTRPHSPSSPTLSVRRRFRDVVALSDRLALSHRGLFIPPRPDKSPLDSHITRNPDFLQTRQSAIQKYLHRLASHPVIAHSLELRAFLTAPGKTPLLPVTDVASRVLDGAVRLPQQLFGEGGAAAAEEAAQPAKGGRDLLRMFKELTQSVANDWGGGKPLAVEEDKEFLERKERIQDLEQQLVTTSQQVFSS